MLWYQRRGHLLAIRNNAGLQYWSIPCLIQSLDQRWCLPVYTNNTGSPPGFSPSRTPPPHPPSLSASPALPHSQTLPVLVCMLITTNLKRLQLFIQLISPPHYLFIGAHYAGEPACILIFTQTVRSSADRPTQLHLTICDANMGSIIKEQTKP